MCTPMHQILPPSPLPPHHHGSPMRQSGALYLGSLTACLDTSLLHSHHITHLVQVLDVPWLPLSEKDGFKCYRIDIMDISSADLRPHLEGVCGYIDNALKKGESVLVHCQQGVSRSPAVIIAYLIRSRSMSYAAAYDLVKHKRPCIKPNSGFVKMLQEWEAQWQRPGWESSSRPPMMRSQTTAASHGPVSGSGRPGMNMGGHAHHGSMGSMSTGGGAGRLPTLRNLRSPPYGG